jgi:hypothetical protein
VFALPARWVLRSVLLTATGALLAASVGVVAHADTEPAATDAVRGTRLAAQLRQAIDDQAYQEVIDMTPPSAGGPRPIHQMPNVDAAVIELDHAGRPRSTANVLFSPRYPDGVAVPLDRNMYSDQVRWRYWNDGEWDSNNGQGTRDVLPGRETARLDFSSPYPASVLKLMVGFGVSRLVTQGAISLDGAYAYQPVTPRPACGGAVTKPVRQFFDEMITVSRNESTCALIKLIHDHGTMDELNQTFVDLGLPTLKLIGSPDHGGAWSGTNMSAMDTAKLLLLINGGPGRLWTRPDGTAVTAQMLSPTARQFFLRTLGDQGHNEMLSTTNWCGRGYPTQGIPQLTPPRWTNAQDGTMTVGGVRYGQDVRPCDANAEVTFAHKNGWVDTTGADAGIVHSLPGKTARHYIIAVFSNVGTDYTDPNSPPDTPGLSPVLYSEKHAKLGRAIDTFMKPHCAQS